MKYEIREKEIHDHIIFYKEGVIEDYSHLSEFILKAGEECSKLNPSIKCEEPDYCYVEYLNKGYKEKDVKIRYSQAVTRFGKEDDSIKFKEIKKIKLYLFSTSVLIRCSAKLIRSSTNTSKIIISK